MTNPLARQVVDIPPDLRRISDLRRQLNDFLETKTPLGATLRDSIVLALDEAVTNVITHTFLEKNRVGPEERVTVSMSVTSGRFILEIQDNGEEFNPLTNLPVNQKEWKELFRRQLEENMAAGRDSGLGVSMYLKVMDEVHHHFTRGRGNCLSLVKYLPKNFPQS